MQIPNNFLCKFIFLLDPDRQRICDSKCALTRCLLSGEPSQVIEFAPLITLLPIKRTITSKYMALEKLDRKLQFFNCALSRCASAKLCEDSAILI
jgi:hypothetical protein